MLVVAMRWQAAWRLAPRRMVRRSAPDGDRNPASL